MLYIRLYKILYIWPGDNRMYWRQLCGLLNVTTNTVQCRTVKKDREGLLLSGRKGMMMMMVPMMKQKQIIIIITINIVSIRTYMFVMLQEKVLRMIYMQASLHTQAHIMSLYVCEHNLDIDHTHTHIGKARRSYGQDTDKSKETVNKRYRRV